MNTESPAPIHLCILVESFGGGGAERVAVNLANLAVDRGWQVDVAAFVATGPNRARLRPAVRVVDLAVPYRPLRLLRWAVPRFRRYLRTERPAAVLATIRDANIAAVLARGLAGPHPQRPTVVLREANTLDAVIAPDGRPRQRGRLWFMRRTYHRGDALIANSDDTRQDLIDHRLVDGTAVTVIPNPVLDGDPRARAAESPPDPWPRWFDQPDTPVILGMGRFQPQKDFATLIRAFAQVHAARPETRLVILGDGTERDTLTALADELGIGAAVAMPGYHDNPFPAFARAAVFVLSSRWEGFGNVLVEALSVGTPVVSTACPGGPRTILADGRYGRLVPVGDPAPMATAITATLDSPPDPATLRTRAADFTVEKTGTRYLDTIEHAHRTRSTQRG